jgi:hypothetical protein
MLKGLFGLGLIGGDERDRKDLTTREKRLMREAMRGFMKAEKALENLT